MADAGKPLATEKIAPGRGRGGAGDRPISPRVSLLIYHREGAEIVPLTGDKPIVIGRMAPADVVVVDQSLSRQHARFSLREGAVHVEDLASTNGTYFRGQPVEETSLRSGDEVQLGAVSVTVHELTGSAGRVRGLMSHDRFREPLEEI